MKKNLIVTYSPDEAIKPIFQEILGEVAHIDFLPEKDDSDRVRLLEGADVDFQAFDHRLGCQVVATDNVDDRCQATGSDQWHVNPVLMSMIAGSAVTKYRLLVAKYIVSQTGPQ